MSSTVITYKGKQILHNDHRGLKGDELLRSVKEGYAHLARQPGVDLLSLTDMTGTFADDAVMEFLKTDVAKTAEKKVKKGAVVGIVGVKKILFNVYNTVTSGGKSKVFDSEEEAKEWLIQ